MKCTPEELLQKKSFEDAYSISQSPVMRSIERKVCGCDYGGNSWTTRSQADDLIKRLRLGTKTCLLDLGAGSGWPALHIASQSKSQVVLVDLPEIGLHIAKERAATLGISDLVTTSIADAADLPFPHNNFDAISHSDLLCCLVRKRSVLEECRRVIRKGGLMAFTVISIAPGLSATAFSRAVANGPDFIETVQDYPVLLAGTGWHIKEQVDLTESYGDTVAEQILADRDQSEDLAALIGQQRTEDRLARWQAKLSAIHDGLFRRALYVVSPA